MNLQLPKSMSPVTFGKNITQAKNSWTEPVLLIIVTALFSWFLVLPKYNQSQALNSQLTDLKKQQSEVSNNLDLFNGMVAKLKQNQQQVEKLDIGLPLDNRNYHLQDLIQNLASQAGVTLQDLNVPLRSDEQMAGDTKLLQDPYVAVRTLKTVQLSVFAVGSFSNLESFMINLENSGRILEIQNFELNPALLGSLALRVDLKAYYYSAD